MSGFRKAKCEQAAVKMSMYGPPGSGKTFSALLFAEGLAQVSGKRIAFVDTELGTQFYSIAVVARRPHPEAFDFDVLNSRSLTEVLKELQELDPQEHGVIVLDSVSHLWDAAINAYSGPKTRAGTIPMWAWSKIKRPYKDLMKFLLDSPFHVFILGRQANAFEEDAETGESKAAGVKMRAEGETAYEPHVCLRMMPERNKKDGSQKIVAFAEKDRSGILACKKIEWPDFLKVIAPLLGIMGHVQAHAPSDDDAAAQDAETLAGQERERATKSTDLVRTYRAEFELATTPAELKAIGNRLTPAIKKLMTSGDLELVRVAYGLRDQQLKGIPATTIANNNGEED